MLTRGVWFSLLLTALLWASPVGAEDPLAAPHAFDDGVQALRDQLEAGDCEQALIDFKALMEAHKGQDYVKARRIEIEELAMELACGAKHERPKAKDLIDAKLSKWSAKTGKIKVTFTPDKAKDLETRDGILWLPPRITGPFTLEIKGSGYPVDADQFPLVIFGGDQDPDSSKAQTWRLECGAPVKSGRSAAKVEVQLVHVDGTDKKAVSTKKTSAPKPGKPYKVRLKGAKKKLTATVFGKSSGYTKKPEAMWGFLGFRAGNWTQATLSGEIEPSWIEGRLDEVRRTQLADFAEDYDPDTVLPEWLSDPMNRRRSRARGNALDLIAELPNSFTDQLQDVYNAVRLDEYEEAFATIAKMQAGGAPEATCEYLRAEARKRMTQLEKALTHLDRCLELAPKFLEGALLKGSILQELGRYGESLESFQLAMAGDAQYPRVYEEAASSMLMAGRPADTKKITQLAARNGVTSETLLTLNDALAKVVRGPRWRKRFEHRSQNYHVLSNMDQSLCREAARTLEDSFAAYRVTFGWVPRDKTRLFKVYLFNTRKGFIAYMGDLEEFMGKPSDQAAGVFSPLLKQLLIWNLPQRDAMFDTIRHEGFHQYLDRLMSSPPRWFNEGLAVYHENPKTVDGKLVFAQMHPNYIRLLKHRGLKPLDKFLYYGPEQFYGAGHASYAQAWLLVHMLQHSKPEYQALWKRLVKELQTESSYVVLKRSFSPELLNQLQEDLKRYLEKLGKS